jgi:hypothetical protein
MPGESRIVPFVSLTIADFNPNHKYRFLVWVPPEQRWLAHLAFAKGDDSIYLAPHLQRQYTLTGHDCGGSDFAIVVEPHHDLHVSFHESGAVNLTAGGRRIELRGKEPTAPHPHILAVGIKDPSGLTATTDEKINALPKRYSVLPVTGFLHPGPVYLSIFRVSMSEQWQMPGLSDTFQMHFECLVREKKVKYEFVVWQNAGLPQFAGQVAISLLEPTYLRPPA